MSPETDTQEQEVPTLMYKYIDFTDEVKTLCSINDRFDNEPMEVREVRISYANIFQRLTQLREDAGRSEAGRNYSIAITELENSCIRAVKGLYSK